MESDLTVAARCGPASATPVAGIAWNAVGYEITILGGERSPMEVEIFAADAVGSLVSFLAQRAKTSDGLVAVLDSTNGLLDGLLTRAGIDLYRADPVILPKRPVFGSVSSLVLAHRAKVFRAHLSRLSPTSGALAGRIAEHAAQIERTVDAERMAGSGNCISHGDRRRREVALTFDDGPYPPFTARILDILREYEAPGTFFCVGMNLRAYPQQVERILADGHAIGNHTWSHPFLPDLSLDELALQIEWTNRVLDDSTGAFPLLVRPPYGSRTPEILRWAAGKGIRLMLWDTDSADWSAPGKEEIVRRVLSTVRNGSIVLMHDGCGDRVQTVDALPGVIEGIMSMGYSLVRADEITG